MVLEKIREKGTGGCCEGNVFCWFLVSITRVCVASGPVESTSPISLLPRGPSLVSYLISTATHERLPPACPTRLSLSHPPLINLASTDRVPAPPGGLSSQSCPSGLFPVALCMLSLVRTCCATSLSFPRPLPLSVSSFGIFRFVPFPATTSLSRDCLTIMC